VRKSEPLKLEARTPEGRRQHSSRRAFLKSAAMFAGAAGLVAGQGTTRRSPLLYIATYSSPQGPEGSKGYGEGIYLFEMNPANGRLSKRDVFQNPNNPSWLAFDPARAHLYSANETNTYNGTPSGSVSA
jgi:hypothetical protein